MRNQPLKEKQVNNLNKSHCSVFEEHHSIHERLLDCRKHNLLENWDKLWTKQHMYKLRTKWNIYDSFLPHNSQPTGNGDPSLKYICCIFCNDELEVVLKCHTWNNIWSLEDQRCYQSFHILLRRKYYYDSHKKYSNFFKPTNQAVAPHLLEVSFRYADYLTIAAIINVTTDYCCCYDNFVEMHRIHH